MAGIIIGLADETNKDFERIRQAFEILKGLKASYEFSGNRCKLIKYKRRYDDEDYNYFDNPHLALCSVGTLLYKHYNLQESINELGKSLTHGESISKVAEDIDGTFCLIILKKKQHKLYIITDIGGVINTYFYIQNHTFFLSTSMLALAKCFNVTPQTGAISTFIRSGMFLDGTTYFKEIRVLKPASIYEYDFNNPQLQRKQYWTVPKEVDEDISFDDAVSRITKSLRRIIDCIPNENAIYDFTGGYDSRFVVSLAYSREKNKSLINAFFFGPPSSREAKIVEQNCLNLGITYHNYVVQDDWPEKFYDYILESSNLSDGLENACAYAQVLMNQKLKRERFRYSVHGLFGELYRQRRWITEFGRRGQRRSPNLKQLIKYRDLADDFDRSIFSDAYSKKINDTPDRLLNIYKKTNAIFDQRAPNTLQLDYIYFSQRARRWGGRSITTANQIIQPICPLWFRRPLEISFSLPPQYKKRCKLMRFIVENESSRFAKEKMITGTPFVVINLRTLHLFPPAIIFFLRKAIRKFSQIAFNKTIWAGLTTPDYNTGEWYRCALEDQRCVDLLDYDKMASKEFYEKRRFNEFVQKAKNHDFHFYGQLGNIITAELTLRAAKLKEEGKS